MFRSVKPSRATVHRTVAFLLFESHPPEKKRQDTKRYPVFFSGVGNGTRTHNARNHNPVLCQLNYTHQILICRGDHWSSALQGIFRIPRPSQINLARQKGLVCVLLCKTKVRLGQALAGNAHPRCIESFSSICPAKKFGTPEGTRTPDLLLRRQLLYPAELLAHIFGAGDGNRTRVSSLEGWCSTIELHPQIHAYLAVSARR